MNKFLVSAVNAPHSSIESANAFFLELTPETVKVLRKMVEATRAARKADVEHFISCTFALKAGKFVDSAEFEEDPICENEIAEIVEELPSTLDAYDEFADYGENYVQIGCNGDIIFTRYGVETWESQPVFIELLEDAVLNPVLILEPA